MNAGERMASGLVCPAPAHADERVQLGHGSGGIMTAALISGRFVPQLANEILANFTDAAVVPIGRDEIAVSTDSFVVQPIEFPGGNIGSLAVHGTVNDVAMMGARPRYLTAAFVLEEGLPLDVLDRVIAAMADAVREAAVRVVAADTKVVERGKADGLYINTTGVGSLDPVFRPHPARVRPGDAVILSGPLARHGIAVMAARDEFAFDTEIESDSANLYPLVERLLHAIGPSVHALRDPTRGGVASALNEIAGACGYGIDITEDALPLDEPVMAACEMLGLDPLYVANEGTLLAFVAPHRADLAVDAMRRHPLGIRAARIGTVVAEHPGVVGLHTALGGHRVVDMLPGDQLPRIC